MVERSGIGTVVVLGLLLAGLFLIVPMFGIMWGPTMMMGGGMMGRWGYPSGMGWGFMSAGVLMFFVFIVLLVTGAYLLLKPQGERMHSETAVAILNERYARGELAKEQYLEMKEQLAKK